MYFAQLILTVISFFFLCNNLCNDKLKAALILLIASLILLDLFRNIVARDLNTHTKYVLIHYNERLREEIKEQNENTPSDPASAQ